MSSLSRGVDEHCARAVDHVSRRHLSSSGLQHVFHLTARSARDLPDNGEDGSHRNVYVDVGGAIEWIEEETVLPALEPLGNLDDVRFFFRRDGAKSSTVIDRLDDDLVGDDVELLLRFTLDIDVLSRTENVSETSASDFVGNHLRREREIVQQP